ncbi:2-C-methyl-D-erythritol 4-phosphate cytidylyltransferase [Ruminococcus flavefaciens]|uniref:2-C-methyl-D-erythritol 4-phosphate cytidylyltransferase n=1 Tax=Ruminococcus flavefaciens TaxID=1265 RepID=A0A1H6KI05_RUMFL|nr:2-C-methyl-D-erythritol 4-phosphate cytidylyltransferase [Ruminococcus flavefaciens]SEH74999.1 2-C-methyl-D-erythritol 4-phosphate cytidylyltransferase [Ruminococcus flavefaciens]
MNIAIIFAGGTGQRMNTKTKPKQFLELHGKPILVYTVEQFQNHDKVDKIVLVMLESWIDYCEKLVSRYQLDKVAAIVPGGKTGQESIYNGLAKAYELFGGNNTVLIHDGVRPLISSETISDDIECAEKNGNAITVSPAIETITMEAEDGSIGEIVDRSKCRVAKAPQCFKLEDIVAAHKKAQEENRSDFIDSASLMKYYGHKLFPVEGGPENIKITTPSDFYIFRAITDAKENSQIFGL